MFVEKKQNTTFMSGKNISIPLTNIIFRFTVNPDYEKIEQVRGFFGRIRRRTYLIQIGLLAIIIMLLLTTFYLIGKLNAPLLSFIAIMTASYLLFIVLGLLLLRRPQIIPIRHNILIHSPPRGFPSVIVLTDYLPRGRSFAAIPIDTIGRIGLLRRPMFPWLKNLKMEVLELLIMDRKDRVIARFGGLCKEDDMKKAAVDLWRKIREIREKPEALSEDFDHE